MFHRYESVSLDSLVDAVSLRLSDELELYGRTDDLYLGDLSESLSEDRVEELDFIGSSYTADADLLLEHF